MTAMGALHDRGVFIFLILDDLLVPGSQVVILSEAVHLRFHFGKELT